MKANATTRASSAFSLVELSIVLVILGLLVGGVLSGQSLIRAAELRAVSTEYSRYYTAAQSFRDKYFAIPGDMRNATAFWGNAGATNCVNNSGTTVTTPGTCDGNADGVMASAALTNGATGEGQQFWRHLALAGLIEGTYTGLNDSTTTGNSSTLGVNVPKSKLNNAGWAITSSAPVTTAAYDLSGAGGYGNYFIFGATLTGNIPATAVLKPEEAWNIDTKLDDGKPGTGKVVARYWNNLCATSTSNTDFAGNYKLSDSSAQCALYFPNAI